MNKIGFPVPVGDEVLRSDSKDWPAVRRQIVYLRTWSVNESVFIHICAGSALDRWVTLFMGM